MVTCDECGREFERPVGLSIHRSRAHDAKLSDRPDGKTGRDVPCEQCGKVFYVHKARIEASKHLFCCMTCKGLFTRKDGPRGTRGRLSHATGAAAGLRELHQRVVDAIKADHERSATQIAEACACSSGLAKKVRVELEEAGIIPHWRAPRGRWRQLNKATEALLADPVRLNPEVAEEIGCNKNTILKARHRLEQDGSIARYRGWLDKEKYQSALAELRANHQRPNLLIAGECGTSEPTVAKARAELERSGELPRWRGDENGEVGYTYFVQAKTLGLIKIGKTVRRKRRLPLLYSQSPDEIVSLGIVHGAWVEKELHRQLKPFIHHHEWFHPTPEVLQAIAERLSENPATWED